MSDSARIVVDSVKVNALLNELRMSDKDTKKAVKAGLRNAANIIRKGTVENLRGVTNQDGSPLKTDRIKKGVRVSVFRNANGAKIELLGSRGIGRKSKMEDMSLFDYRLRFFELGTKERRTKSHRRWGQGRKGIKRSGKPGNRGRIIASKFFNKAVNTYRTRAELSIQDAIIMNIQRVASRRK